jgi:hypothetical protein
MPNRVANEAAFRPPPPIGAAMPTAGIADGAINFFGCRMKDCLFASLYFFVSEFDFNRFVCFFWMLAFW